MNARTQAHRPVEDGSKILFTAAVHHGARRVIHWSEKHPGERQRYVMLGICIFAPLVLLRSPHAFNIDQVGPGTSHRRWSDSAMKINQHLTPSGFTANLVIKVDYRLIVALHEINLEPFHSPLLSLVKSRLELIVKRLPNHPKNNSHILFLAISH